MSAASLAHPPAAGRRMRAPKQQMKTTTRMSDCRRRGALTKLALVSGAAAAIEASGSMLRAPAWAYELVEADIQPELAPDQSKYNTSDPRLIKAGQMFQKALNAPSVYLEELFWTDIIDEFGGEEDAGADWRDDLGKLTEAIEDFNVSIRMAPYAVDPVLNRGVALEALKDYPAARRDYIAALEASRGKDPAAWNNLGNVAGAMGDWQEAADDYKKAMNLSPEFAFAQVNYANALYEIGKTTMALRELRSILRRYPEFPDARAALTATLWAEDLQAEAETNWERVSDLRYSDREWVRNTRRWPPKVVSALEDFLDIKRGGN